MNLFDLLNKKRSGSTMRSSSKKEPVSDRESRSRSCFAIFRNTQSKDTQTSPQPLQDEVKNSEESPKVSLTTQQTTESNERPSENIEGPRELTPFEILNVRVKEIISDADKWKLLNVNAKYSSRGKLILDTPNVEVDENGIVSFWGSNTDVYSRESFKHGPLLPELESAKDKESVIYYDPDRGYCIGGPSTLTSKQHILTEEEVQRLTSFDVLNIGRNKQPPQGHEIPNPQNEEKEEKSKDENTTSTSQNISPPKDEPLVVFEVFDTQKSETDSKEKSPEKEESTGQKDQLAKKPVKEAPTVKPNQKQSPQKTSSSQQLKPYYRRQSDQIIVSPKELKSHTVHSQPPCEKTQISSSHQGQVNSKNKEANPRKSPQPCSSSSSQTRQEQVRISKTSREIRYRYLNQYYSPPNPNCPEQYEPRLCSGRYLGANYPDQFNQYTEPGYWVPPNFIEHRGPRTYTRQHLYPALSQGQYYGIYPRPPPMYSKPTTSSDLDDIEDDNEGYTTSSYLSEDSEYSNHIYLYLYSLY
ncbi:unnamed protein product [Hymenolepis diminuta]|uniref:Uncharacterized protein n=1 Tax=Hymenolepis diminuta TaxID=6216 RepID=A0A564Z357_HYMDI|nr:unnamed protein product [Hymenolepis diminuta]